MDPFYSLSPTLKLYFLHHHCNRSSAHFLCLVLSSLSLVFDDSIARAAQCLASLISSSRAQSRTMSGNPVLSDRDVNAPVMTGTEVSVGEVKAVSKSLDYHRQMLQSRINDEKSNPHSSFTISLLLILIVFRADHLWEGNLERVLNMSLLPTISCPPARPSSRRIEASTS